MLCCMFLAKWKITRKSATICARRNSFIIANNNCVYAAESAIYHCHSRLIYNQPNTACKNTRNRKIVFFIPFSFLQQLIAKIYCKNHRSAPKIDSEWFVCFCENIRYVIISEGYFIYPHNVIMQRNMEICCHRTVGVYKIRYPLVYWKYLLFMWSY